MKKGINSLLFGSFLSVATPAFGQENLDVQSVSMSTQGTTTKIDICLEKEPSSQAKVDHFVDCANQQLERLSGERVNWQRELIISMTLWSRDAFPEQAKFFEGCARNPSDCNRVQQLFFEHDYFINWFGATLLQWLKRWRSRCSF